MTGRMTYLLATATRAAARLALLAVLALPMPALAADTLPIDAFYGHYQGSGVAENADSLYFGVTVRDIDVRVGPKGNGFFVEWTSVIRSGGDPRDPDIKRRSQSIDFVPGATPGVYAAPGAQDPRSPDGLVWARLQDHTLTVNVMRITADGGYVVQTYNRTVDGNGMKLEFINVRDGEAAREVEARLVKVGN